MTQKQSERAEAIAMLKQWYPKGSTVYTVLRHVSRSGMMRTIGIVAIIDAGNTKDGYADIRHPNHATGAALGYTVDKQRDGLKVSGCGMDMGFHVVDALARTLYGDGKALSHRWL